MFEITFEIRKFLTCRSGVTGSCHKLAGTDGTQFPPNVNKVIGKAFLSFLLMQRQYNAVVTFYSFI